MKMGGSNFEAGVPKLRIVNSPGCDICFGCSFKRLFLRRVRTAKDTPVLRNTHHEIRRGVMKFGMLGEQDQGEGPPAAAQFSFAWRHRARSCHDLRSFRDANLLSCRVEATGAPRTSESVREDHVGLHSVRSMGRRDARLGKAGALRLRHAKNGKAPCLIGSLDDRDIHAGEDFLERAAKDGTSAAGGELQKEGIKAK